jgi:hypothetical protein
MNRIKLFEEFSDNEIKVSVPINRVIEDIDSIENNYDLSVAKNGNTIIITGDRSLVLSFLEKYALDTFISPDYEVGGNEYKIPLSEK